MPSDLPATLVDMSETIVAADFAELLRAGFVVVPYPSDAPLLALADTLGQPADQRVLHARNATDAPENTLTARHGLGALPAHTDGAAQPLPPRWLVMRALTATAAATVLYDASPAILDPANRPHLRRPWIVVPGGTRVAFYAPIVQSLPGGFRLRYNEACMRPPPYASRPECLAALEPIEHVWRQEEALIIDNWRCMHARAAVDPAETRRLERITVR